MDTSTPHPALPPTVRLATGSGGLPAVRVEGPQATATLYLQGAHLTDWTPAGRDPVLWMSSASAFVAGTPIRGGIPLCFPWFVAHPTATGAPAHGFARRTPWQLVAARQVGDATELVLRLADTDATRSGPWPYRFEAEFTVGVGATLTLSLTVTNRDTRAFTFEEALHTYLRIGDVRRCSVTGLEGAGFVEKAVGPDLLPGEVDPVRFDGEVDRVYVDHEGSATVLDDAGPRRIRVGKSGSRSTVVWNPGSALAAGMADMGPGEWTSMVCVETCNVGVAAVTLAPGESHTMTATLDIES